MRGVRGGHVLDGGGGRGRGHLRKLPGALAVARGERREDRLPVQPRLLLRKGCLCTQCAPNSYADAIGMYQCTACLANSESHARSVANTSCLCVPGFYGEPAGPCTMCEADTYSAVLGTKACALCPTNAQAPPGSTTVTACACNAGYAGLNGGECTACAAGSFKDSVGEALCVECAAGKFLESTAGNVSCRGASGWGGLEILNGIKSNWRQ